MVFGAGGGTNSYQEIEDTDVILLWGSNARETHPIFLHRLLKGVRHRAMICWTLGITEHHNAVDNVLALINLALLTGHVGKYGSGLNPLRGQNNVQGGGDMGALPDRLTGFQHVENAALREKFEKYWGVKLPPHKGWHLSQMFEAIERGELRALYVIGENP